MSNIRLPARADRGAAEALLPDFIAALGSGSIDVDGGDVTHASQAILQLLLCARRSGEAVRITPSPALREAAELADLAELLFAQGDAA